MEAKYISRVRNGSGNGSTVYALYIYNYVAECLDKYVFFINKEVIVFLSRSYKLEAILLVVNINNNNIIS